MRARFRVKTRGGIRVRAGAGASVWVRVQAMVRVGA